MRTRDFDFDLPPELIAQSPAPTRDQSRLLVLHRAPPGIEHRQFRDLLEYIQPGDLLVLNNSKVIPARLRAINPATNGKFEMLLLEENSTNDWWAMLRPAKRARPGTRLRLVELGGALSEIEALTLETNAEGHRRFRFEGTADIALQLDRLGEVPLPPYIDRPSDRQVDRERYQTVYAQPPGSVAAPTAGLHFTPELLQKISEHGIAIAFVTLHVGPATFAPVKTDHLEEHPMHEERYDLPVPTAELIERTRRQRGRIIAVGTTALRVLESCAGREPSRAVSPGPGRTRLFVYPPRSFAIVDALLTNFHLPRSTLLMLVSAFAAPGATSGRDLILRAYMEAIERRYRFFSYGDAMLIV